MAGAVIGKGGHNIQKLRTEVCIDEIISCVYFRIMIWFTLFFKKEQPLQYPVS